MPYEPPKDPTALPTVAESPQIHVGRETSGTREILRNLKDERTIADLTPELAELRATVERNTAVATASAEETIAADHTVRVVLPSVGVATKRSVVARDEAADILKDRRDLSDEGIDEAKKDLNAKLDTGLARLGKAVLGDECDGFLSRHPASEWPPLTPELSAEVAAKFSGFRTKLASTHVREAVSTLREALTAPTGDQRYRSNVLLREYFGPTCERRGISPEHHARNIARLNAELARLIATHLDNVRGGHRHRLAEEIVAEARQQFNWLLSSVRQEPRWPEGDVLFIGTPRLLPAKDDQ